jgi:acetolactate synthase-1/2/3 large subunit
VNGAEALARTLAGAGVRICFANPGTSEIHLVAALDRVPELRGVLCLFEGVATGAADGFGRMTGRPAATLLHLGPGLGNGLAGLHNARRGRTPLVSLVGDHATYHKRFDAPLESDIDALAGSVSGWVRRTLHPGDLARDAAEAVATAAAGTIATLIVPADLAWADGAEVAPPFPARRPARAPERVLDDTAALLRGDEPALILLGGDGLRRAGLEAASRIAAATGAKLLAETFPARMERGAGLPRVGRLAYLAEMAAPQLAGTRHLILAGTPAPVSFFAYPGQASSMVPDGAEAHLLAGPGDDVTGALTELADLVAADTKAAAEPPARPEIPGGGLDAGTASAVIGALLPEGAIVSDESNTSGIGLGGATAGAPPHDWLAVTGGAIGHGLPMAVGAALACPDRPVIALESDGSAMYTISGLWTCARENLNVTTVVFSNRAYAILGLELMRATSEAGEVARSLLDLSRPTLDFVQLAAGMGVPARRAATTAQFADALRAALAEDGPHLIEAALP